MDDLVKRLLAGTGGGKHWMDLHEEAAARIAALEAQVRAADALAEALKAYNRGGAGPLTGWIDVEQSLAAYREGSDT